MPRFLTDRAGVVVRAVDPASATMLNVELFEASGTTPLTTLPAPTGACIVLIGIPINDREDILIGVRDDMRARSEYDTMH